MNCYASMISYLELIRTFPNGNDSRKNSSYFDGPQNTVEQGAPVQLIYGDEILVGSQLVSLKLSVEQLIPEK